KNNSNLHALQSRPKFDNAGFSQIFFQPIEQLHSELFVRNLASAESDCGFDFVSVFQYLDGMLHFEIVVVFIRRRTEFDFFDLNDDLLFLGLVRLFLLLVKIFAEIYNPADRRLSLGRDLHKIIAPLTRNLHGVMRRHHADHLSFFIDHTHLFRAYPLVDTYLRTAPVVTTSAKTSTALKATINKFTSV